MISIIKNNKWLLIIFAAFIFTRFFGLGQIYHQDEYRWAMIANPAFEEGSGVHPPITRAVLGLAGHIWGYNNLRAAPFIFSILNLWLVYLISFKLSNNKKTALTAAVLFTSNIYSFIANLQIDIDGAILPFFILLGYYAYLNLEAPVSKKWLIVLGLSVIGGFLTKLSYLLFIGAIMADQGLRAYFQKGSYVKDVFKKTWRWLAGFSAVVVLFYYFYSIEFSKVIIYAENFKSLNFASRAYFDLIFKIFKSFVWLSPLLALPILYGFFKINILNKYRLWFVYLFLNLIFYLVLFDFSTLTIERYFMFLVAPSVLISAQVISDFLDKQHVRKSFYIITAVAFALIFYFILSLPHNVLPLNPKEAYVNKIKSLDFRFLIPFTGGSGPSGFYFSALFIMASWLFAAASFTLIILKKYKELFLAAFIVFGLGYNFMFDSEYLFGTVYGSVDKVAKETIEYVNSNKAIKEVITYYDIGAYYLRLSGKYSSRFYTAPKRDYAPKIANYRGQYMIVDFPAIEKNGRYWPLISRCPLLKKFQDKKIESYVFDCSRI